MVFLQTPKKQEISLETIVRVYNINHGKNPQMLEKSKTLGGYSYFVDKIREYEKSNNDLAEAIKNAVEYCIEHDVLVDFLTKHKAEVIEMLLELGTFENTLAVKCEMAYNKGLQKGQRKGKKKRNTEVARSFKNLGTSFDVIQKATGLSLDEIENL